MSDNDYVKVLDLKSSLSSDSYSKYPKKDFYKLAHWMRHIMSAVVQPGATETIELKDFQVQAYMVRLIPLTSDFEVAEVRTGWTKWRRGIYAAPFMTKTLIENPDLPALDDSLGPNVYPCTPLYLKVRNVSDKPAAFEAVWTYRRAESLDLTEDEQKGEDIPHELPFEIKVGSAPVTQMIPTKEPVRVVGLRFDQGGGDIVQAFIGADTTSATKPGSEAGILPTDLFLPGRPRIPFSLMAYPAIGMSLTISAKPQNSAPDAAHFKVFTGAILIEPPYRSNF